MTRSLSLGRLARSTSRLAARLRRQRDLAPRPAFGQGLEPLESRVLMSTATQFLQAEPQPPRFADGSTLIPLSRWGWQLAQSAALELSDKWGYAIELGNATQSYVNGLDNPASDISQKVAYAAADPQHRALAVLVDRPLFNASFVNTLPPETWLRDAGGNFILDNNGKKVWSPEAPNSVFEQAGALAAAPLAKIISKANGAPLVLLNGGEYALGVYGWNGTFIAQDPAVLAAKGSDDWFTYLSKAKARQEKLISDAVKAVAPDRDLYIHYFDDGALDRGVYGTYWQWVYDYHQMRGNSDLPNNSLYYKEFNTGWSGTRDLLSQELGSTAQHIALGDTVSYNWVNGGYGTNYGFSDDAHYMGFLKSLYLAGMVGGVAGYFSFPTGGFGADLGTTIPSWLQQIMSLGQAQGLFSHVEGFLRDGTLLPGPNMHRWSTDLPAYEFPTGDPDTRVIVRQNAQGNQWLISAWAAAGNDRPATVTVPVLGQVTLQARAVGSVYLASLVDGIPSLTLLDTDGMHPTADLNIVHVNVGPHGQADHPGDQVVRTGQDFELHITPDAGYRVLELLLDGQALDPANQVTLSGVNKDHSVKVTFAPLPAQPPRVTGVLADGSGWSAGFRGFLAGAGLGDADGYAIPSGSGAQLDPLPWSNIDRLTLRFSQPVTIAEGDLSIRGVNVAAYGVAAFTVGVGPGGAFEATWTLVNPIGVDKLLLHLADSVIGAPGIGPGGLALDGEWTNPISRATPAGGSSHFASGDGVAGGAFDFRFDVVPGDANRNGGVNVQDVVLTRNRQGSTAASPANYSPFSDINGNGGINVQDVVLTRNQQGKTLPAGEPSLPASAARLLLASPLSIAPTAVTQARAPEPAASSAENLGRGWRLRWVAPAWTADEADPRRRRRVALDLAAELAGPSVTLKPVEEAVAGQR